MLSIQSIVINQKSLTPCQAGSTVQGTTLPQTRLFLTLTDESGLSVESECVALDSDGYSKETVETTLPVLQDKLIPLVVGESFESPVDLHETLVSAYPEYPMARAAIEMGGWALMAKSEDIPLTELIEGVYPRVPAGYVCLPSDDPQAIAEQVAQAEKDGYFRAKIKTTPQTDTAILDAVRAMCPDFPLWIDGNESYGPEHIQHLCDLDRYNLMMIEQPFPRRDWPTYAQLCKKSKLLVCHDESITSEKDVLAMIQHRAGEIVCLKPGRVGGFTESFAIHDLCMRAGLSLWIGGMYETNVGKAYTTALATLPGVRIPGDFSPSGHLYQEEMGWSLVDGYIQQTD